MNLENQQAIDNAITALHKTPHKVFLASTGAGAGITKLLWNVAGSSQTLLGSVFPYHRRELVEFIGHEPEKFCSVETAIAMATSAFFRGQECVALDNQLEMPVIGIGLTAAVATDKPKKGDHRVYLAIRSAHELTTVSVTFTKGYLDRAREGEVSDLLALNAILSAAGLEQVLLPNLKLVSEELAEVAPEHWVVRPSIVHPENFPAEQFFEKPFITVDGKRESLRDQTTADWIIVSGSFNPLHFGHHEMAELAEKVSGRRAVFELATTNADKSAIDTVEISRRAHQFRGRWPVVLSQGSALFIDKVKKYPGAHFVIGADTALRILDPKYYGSTRGLVDTLTEFKKLGTRFYVSARKMNDEVKTCSDLVPPSDFEQLFVPMSSRIWDISSTILRSMK